ncbi:unnamed protein product [Schistosoma rodhaini]|uniref:Mediator of RNA polymerase II transcription subunit 13 n=1 Tax=Schistosoma rodhaini TaxID=6188 RepID=A0AA85FET0_9TREM|nr:unnamed protein product [Schistosoma rodhaini]
MSSMSQSTGPNDASLEHCFTNIFALTDFSGIQYRKYILHTPKEYHDPLNDPIIKSYTLCQKYGVLSAWVRSKPESSDLSNPCAFSKFAKELWVFWYGNDDFPNADSCILPELRREDHGNWRQGLSYETRTVLFRALHNVVERCLLTKGFVRLGKWFVQPRKCGCNDDNVQYSVSFSFFLHGESTVCASLDIRQHAAVQRVGVEHIQSCIASQSTIPVILAPYGISAKLTGFGFEKKDGDLMVESEAWSTFYPLKSSHECDPAMSGVTGLPFFAMATPTHQNPRQQNKFSSDKKRTVEEINRRFPDTPPKFVEVIVDGFRMRYPMCFVLITSVNDSPSQSDYNPTPYDEAIHLSDVSGHNLSTNVSAPYMSNKCSMYNAHIPNKMKTSRFWRVNKRRKRPSIKMNTPGTSLLKSIIPSSSLQSDFLVDVRHIYLAGRTLQCASQHNRLPSMKPEWQSKRSRSTDKSDMSCSTDGLTTSVSPEMCSLYIQDPCTILQCCCNRFSRVRRTSVGGSFHQQDPFIRRSLKSSIHFNVPPCDRPRTPLSMITTNLTATHDPSMPTLSPQQPAPNQNSNLSSNTLNELNNDLACDQNTSQTTPSSTHLSTAPQPPSLLPKPESNSDLSSVVKIPNGLVTTDSPVSSDHQTQYAKMSARHIPIASVSVMKRDLFNTWLARHAAQELQKESSSDIKRPNLCLNIPDRIEREQCICPEGITLQSTIEQSSPSFPNYSIVEDNTLYKENNVTTDEYSFRNKRLRTAICRTDFNECSLNDGAQGITTDITNVNFTSANSYSPDMKVGVTECNGLIDDQHINPGGSETNSHSGLMHSNGSIMNNSSGTFSRNVGLITHRGVSLASSTGSGPIGPAELALMLPTPPSHDAPQPSPVDGVSVSTNRMNPSTTSVSTPGPGSPSVQTIQDSLSSSVTDTSSHSIPVPFQSVNSPSSCQNQGLWHLAKLPCIQNLGSVSMESQDWSFVQPCAAYLGMTSNYQIPHDEISSFSKSLPQLKWSYDHRASNQKSVSSDCVDPHFTPNGLIVNTGNQSTTSKSWLMSPNSFPPTSLHRNVTNTNNKPCSPQQLNESGTTCPITGFVKSADCTNPNTSYVEDFTEWLSSLLETNGLLVNLILSDSMLNLFKDHNFDSCNICECTSSILGSEIGLYLSNSISTTSPCSKSGRTNTSTFGGHDLVGGSGFHFTRGCKCGFSAVMNQKYVVNGNLFYEDEIEVTRLSVRSSLSQSNENLYTRPPNYRTRQGWWVTSSHPSVSHLLLLQRIMSSVFEEFSVRQITDQLRWNMLSCDQVIKENKLEYDNACALISSAIRNSVETVRPRRVVGHADNIDSITTDTPHSASETGAYIHPSFFLKAHSKMPQNQNDQIRLLTTMRPWLQEAISSTRMLESNYTVDGPLTWKAFHQLAGRGSDETCKPQPIPQLRVSSCDQENLLISPFALRDWLYDVSMELGRLVMQSLIGSANHILNSLPESWRSRVTTQILSVDHVMSDYLPRLRPLALAIYTSVNRFIEPSLINANRTLTGIGPAAEKEIISNEKDRFHKRTIFAPPYTLMNSRGVLSQLDISSEPIDRSSVLFVAYCLSQDQQWLLATFTDEQGGLLDHTLINIRVPTRYFTEIENQRFQPTESNKHILSPRRIGLARLWDYIINLISQTANAWRLVVGRIGRLGQGELKGWNGLLGRKSLQDVNKFFRERCSACSTSSCVPSHSSSINNGSKPMLNLINSFTGASSCTHELPSLISACLVSLEPQSTFRVYPGFGLCSDESWTYGGGGGGGNTGGGGGSGGAGSTGASGGLSNGANNAFYGANASPLAMRMMSLLDTPTTPIETPSATHILVFPTSTSASGVSEHEPSGLAEVIYGMGSDDMNVFDWLLPNDPGLDDLVPPNGSTAEMLADFGNPSELNFGLSDLGPPVCVSGVNDGTGKSSNTRLGDGSDVLHGHNEYTVGFHDNRGHGCSDVMGLRGLDSGLLDLGPNQLSNVGGYLSEHLFGHAVNPLNTMPFGIHDPTDEVGSLMQQPLAMGYYISTASAGPLPSWFWIACPHSKFQYPVCLKSALHLQTTLVGVDDAAAAAPPPTGGSSGPGVGPSSNRPGHLLDSNSTCDVLRYVLETYNALSWLTIDPTTNDRRTCLPIHILSLSQIYQAFEAFT